MEILVFKTNLTDAGRISDMEPSLDMHPNIFKWNVDLHDHDNILRIMANDIEPTEVENMLLNAGYYCEELK
ncbi:MAG: copper chaperone [Ferruginibacter sp.]